MPYLLIIFCLVLGGCTEPPAPSTSASHDQTTTFEADEPVVSREAVVLFQASGKLAARITLKIMGEPTLFPSGYGRLAGVVNSSRPVALLEIGGRGLALTVGDQVEGYSLRQIFSDRVILQKSRGRK